MSAFSPSVGKNTYLNTSIRKSWMFFHSSPAAVETSCYSELWSCELRFQRPRSWGSEVWCLQTSVKGEPHVLYVLWEARHSVETFRFHPWKKTNGETNQTSPTVWSSAHRGPEILPLSSISWMHMSTTMGRVVLWALTSVVRSQLNTFFILRRSGWQSLGTSLEHCLCTFSPQSKRATERERDREREPSQHV